MITKVLQLIVGVNFIIHHDLLVDLWNARLLDPTTASGSLKEFPGITHPVFSKQNISHTVKQQLKITDPLVYDGFHRLPLGKLNVARRELEFLLGKSYHPSSSSVCASALHLAPLLGLPTPQQRKSS